MIECKDKNCPFHGNLKIHGMVFTGKVISKKRRKTVTIERELILRVPKFERFMKKRAKIHAHLPECMENKVEEGDVVKVSECRKISKTKSFVVIDVVKKGDKS